MNQDLKIIKKKYGEAMMHLCRELFSTILDNSPGILSSILIETYAPNHFLYDDIVNQKLIYSFRDFIYQVYVHLNVTNEIPKLTVLDPVSLMKQAGYQLYECKNNFEVQKFRKYYAPGEELCTFRDFDRIKKCHIYFAVKDNISEIKRHKFKHPKREDEYGTSVISIQFTRDKSHILSIKNRYNHTVDNPDATYANNLDNIIPGLTQSFADHYGLTQKKHYSFVQNFIIPGYVKANDGKFYKYNYEINNIYYCPDNIVIDNFEVRRYPKERYLVMDYFIIDLANKKFINNLEDSFSNTIGEIKNINISKQQDYKVISIVSIDNLITKITLDRCNRIVSIENDNLISIPNDFLNKVKYLKHINLSNATIVGDNFLKKNKYLEKISLPNVSKVGNYFMYSSSDLKEISLPNVTEVGKCFLYNCTTIKSICFPKLEIIGVNFMQEAINLKSIKMPKIKKIGYGFLTSNQHIKKIIFPKLEQIVVPFLSHQIFYEHLRIFYAPKLSIDEVYGIYFNPKLKLIWEKNNKKLSYIKRKLRSFY